MLSEARIQLEAFLESEECQVLTDSLVARALTQAEETSDREIKVELTDEEYALCVDFFNDFTNLLFGKAAAFKLDGEFAQLSSRSFTFTKR